MSLMQVLDTAAGGMSAQTVRLNVTSSNLANANSVGSKESVYKAKEAVFTAMLDNQLGGNGIANQASVGVKVEAVVDDKTPLQQKYMPNHPQADEKGYVFQTNVNPMTEMANMLSASRDYNANVQMMSTAKQLAMDTLNLLR
jgi:flagellar basal-body rod protein FlgC